MTVAMVFYSLNSKKLTGRHIVWSLTILAVRDFILYGTDIAYGNQRLVGYAPVTLEWLEPVMLG